jgi:hypothetical protein
MIVVFLWLSAVEPLGAPGFDEFAATHFQARFRDDVHGFVIAEAKFGISLKTVTHFKLNDAEIIPDRSN